MEALRSGTPIDKLLIQKVQIGDEMRELLILAKEKGVPISKAPKEKINKLVGNFGLDPRAASAST